MTRQNGRYHMYQLMLDEHSGQEVRARVPTKRLKVRGEFRHLLRRANDCHPVRQPTVASWLARHAITAPVLCHMSSYVT